MVTLSTPGLSGTTSLAVRRFDGLLTSVASQLKFEPLGKVNVPTERHGNLRERSLADTGLEPRSIIAGSVSVGLRKWPSCVSVGAPGGENTPAASATPPPTRTNPASMLVPIRHPQRRRTRDDSSTVFSNT